MSKRYVILVNYSKCSVVYTTNATTKPSAKKHPSNKAMREMRDIEDLSISLPCCHILKDDAIARAFITCSISTYSSNLS